MDVDLIEFYMLVFMVGLLLLTCVALVIALLFQAANPPPPMPRPKNWPPDWPW